MNFSNRTLFHGDNLLFLWGIDSGTIDLIATDPPFNKGSVGVSFQIDSHEYNIKDTHMSCNLTGILCVNKTGFNNGLIVEM